MAKGILVSSVAVAAIGFFAMVIFTMVMMVSMMGGGMMSGSMMGGGMMGGSDPAKEAAVEGVTHVRLENFAFAPANIVVDVGTTVTWTNYDNVPHTVTSDEGGELRSQLFTQNETFSHTFDKAGEYSYYCEPHPNMQGLVTVRAPVAG